MSTSRHHQEAHGLGQVEEQLSQQANAAEQIQGLNETDREVKEAANRRSSELDEIIES
ncbi:hypothetical protein [Paenibacillus turpanensis]|uniref:hypothetical protein n=1 Tax=Paenibacillus turpanensis TaxID=2689078 RepID=UPI00140C177B|nr:hypothetical protein [Paenibacillus turpanensis]